MSWNCCVEEGVEAEEEGRRERRVTRLRVQRKRKEKVGGRGGEKRKTGCQGETKKLGRRAGDGTIVAGGGEGEKEKQGTVAARGRRFVSTGPYDDLHLDVARLGAGEPVVPVEQEQQARLRVVRAGKRAVCPPSGSPAGRAGL